MKHFNHTHFAAVYITVLMLFSNFLYAQAVAEDVLDDIVISNSGHTGIIKIELRIPARYISHTPKQIGKDILIKVALLNNRGAVDDFSGNTNNARETLVPHDRDNYGLQEVSYERIQKEDYLNLHFNKQVSFEIIQDADYRSLTLIIHNAM